jgi:hypothetical protein
MDLHERLLLGRKALDEFWQVVGLPPSAAGGLEQNVARVAWAIEVLRRALPELRDDTERTLWREFQADLERARLHLVAARTLLPH